jgi:hypothetical protein
LYSSPGNGGALFVLLILQAMKGQLASVLP